MENKYVSLTNEELLEKQKKNKQASNIFKALAILLFVMCCFVVGYYFGADAATGGKREFQFSSLPLFSIILTAIIYFSGQKDRKELDEEMKKRGL